MLIIALAVIVGLIFGVIIYFINDEDAGSVVAGLLCGLVFGPLLAYIGPEIWTEEVVVEEEVVELKPFHGARECGTYLNTHKDNSTAMFVYKHVDDENRERYETIRQSSIDVYYEERDNAVLITTYTERDPGVWGFTRSFTYHEIHLPICTGDFPRPHWPFFLSCFI